MALLAPLFTAVGTAISGAASLFSGLGILGKIALVGLQMAVKYAMSRDRKEASGTQLRVEYGEETNRKIILGITATKGHHVFTATYGPSNKYSAQVFRLSDFIITSLERVWFEGSWRTLGTLDATLGYPVNGLPSPTWLKVYKGSMTQAADAYLIANSNGRWTANHKFTGGSYVILTTTYDESKATSPADLLFEIKGAPLYDPRKDTTVGGSGAHRWNNQSTWEFSENPFLMAYNLERGFYRGTEKMIGKGIAADLLPLSNWIVAMNIADETVNGGARYRCSLIAEAGEGVTHASNIDPIMLSCAGSMIVTAYGTYPIAGTSRAVVATITDEDLVAGRPYRFTKYRTRETLFNTITGRFPNVAEGYDQKPYPPRIDAAALAFDGVRRATPINFTNVIYPDQVERLADIYQRANRFQASAELTLMPKWFVLEAGDWIVWQSERHGTRTYEVQESEIASLQSEGARNVMLRLQEVSSAIFGSTAYLYNPDLTIPITDPTYANEATNFSASPVVVQAAGQEAQPAFRFIWDQLDDVTVDKVLVRYRPIGQTDSIVKEASADERVILTADGVLSEEDYEYSHKIIAKPNRTTFWTGWQMITSLASELPSVSVDLSRLQSDAIDLLREMNENLDDALKKVEQIAHDASVGTGQNIVDRKVFLQRLGDAFAQIINETSLRVDADSALAEQLSLVQANVDGTIASSLQSLSSRVDTVDGELVAQADAITSVQATTDNLSAQGLLSFSVQSSPNAGSIVTINMLARAALTGTEDQTTFKTSGLNIELYLDAGVVKSKVSIIADKFVVSDGANTGAPLVFENGQLKLQVARIGSAYVEQLYSANGKLVIKGYDTNASLELFS